MSFTKVAPAGIGTEPGTSIRIGDSLLHSTGIDIGTGTGIGVTIRKHGDATFTGIVTAASFSGSGANLTGIDATSIKHTDGNVKVQAINTGANLTGNLSVSGNLGVAGVLTYEDVTNVDSIGIITARSGIRVGANGTKRETVHLDAGDSGANYLRFTNTTTGNGAADGFNVGINADENALLWNFENKDTIFATNNLERLRINSTGQLLLGSGAIATPKVTQAGSLDLDSGGISLCIGGNENSNGRTNSTNKLNRIVTPHYTNAEEPMAMISGYSTSGASELFYGGGSGLTNAATSHHFYTATGTTTTTGTKRLLIRANGQIIVGEANVNPVNDFEVRRANAGGDVAIRIGNNTSNDASTASLYFTTSPSQNFNTSYIQAKRDGGKLDFGYATNTPIVTMHVSQGKVGISSSIPQRPLDVRGEVFANRFTAYSAPTSTYNNQTTGVKYGARGGYTLTLGGSRNANTNSFTIFDAKDFNNSKYFCLEISFCHAGGGIHGSYRRFAGICNGYTSIQTWNDTGNVNVGGASGFSISKPDNHTLRCVWNGCTGFADAYTLYCMLHVSNGNSYFSAIDSAFY